MFEHLKQLVASLLIATAVSLSPVKKPAPSPMSSYNCYFGEKAHQVQTEKECRNMVADYNRAHPTQTIPTQPNTMFIVCQIDTHCGGGTRQLTAEECKNTTCCEVGKQMLLLQSGELCKQKQKEYYKNFVSETDLWMMNYEKTRQENTDDVQKAEILQNEQKISDLNTNMNNCKSEMDQYAACMSRQNDDLGKYNDCVNANLKNLQDYQSCITGPLNKYCYKHIDNYCSKPSGYCSKPTCSN